MHTTNLDPMFKISIIPNDSAAPAGKLADAEIHFLETAGPFEGLKLIGFSIWQRRTGEGRNVTFPARSYSVNGERRSFALLRPLVDSTAQRTLTAAILDAYAEHEDQARDQAQHQARGVDETSHYRAS